MKIRKMSIMKYCGPEASMVKGKGKELMSYCTFIV